MTKNVLPLSMRLGMTHYRPIGFRFDLVKESELEQAACVVDVLNNILPLILNSKVNIECFLIFKEESGKQFSRLSLTNTI